MTTKDFTTSIVVEQSPKTVFDAINNVRGWWSEEIEGSTDNLNAVFDYHFEDVHRCKMKIVEFIPSKKVVWEVMENYFKFTEDKTEWTGNRIVFEITENNGKTEMRFIQEGLVPEYECFTICRDAWTGYITKSLYNLITTGKGQPNGKDKPRTEDEKNLINKK